MALGVAAGRYAWVVLVPGYKGAATFTGGLSVEIHRADLSQAWENQPADLVSFTVNPGEESGRVDATLTNVVTPSHKLRIAGTWSCQT
jgi:hypothetical protein